jgi:Cd2+/Zn2+-exporting ATPase
VGNLRLFKELGLNLEGVKGVVNRLQQEGKTPMLVGTDNGFLGVIALADQAREAGAGVIASLKEAGINNVAMLTGDNRVVASRLAEAMGADEFHAELLPQDKVKVVEELKARYGRVAMVGDGINDAPALAAATVGIAMGRAGTDAALETADIVLMADDLEKLPFTVRLSRKARKVIRQNIAFSLAIKVLAVVAVFPGWLTLWLAIMADMGATLVVTLNGLRLLKVKPDGRG